MGAVRSAALGAVHTGTSADTPATSPADFDAHDNPEQSHHAKRVDDRSTLDHVDNTA